MANENSGTHPITERNRGLAIARLYRAHIQPSEWRGIERTAFVEAFNRDAAARKIAAAVAALEYGSTTEQVQERIYNVTSGTQLVAEGLSLDHELRLFETGWSGQEAIAFVEHPLFLLIDPAPLCRKWAQIPCPARVVTRE
jgi:hypothetical protein